MSNTSEYRIWRAIRGRCNNPDNAAYAGYGGRGISVAPGFQSFDAFYTEVGPRPPGTSLDRINNDLGYLPGNLRWTDQTTQCRNTRANRFLIFRGKTQCIAAWAEELKIRAGRIYSRLGRGWSVEDALMPGPIRGSLKRKKAVAFALANGVKIATPGEQLAAKRIFDYAILRGIVARQPCEKCGDPKSEGHHTDYSKPLEVRWLCLPHHREAHENYSVVIP
jgi:hypothetical protein